ncbi:hypothetical protein DOY81_009556 [Sarcophaga bullata]|nr:hypothetical protein DOY81_009556 [Sarcophaga bullata]
MTSKGSMITTITATVTNLISKISLITTRKSYMACLAY